MSTSIRSLFINNIQRLLSSIYCRRLARYPELVRVLALTNKAERNTGPVEVGVSDADYVALYETVLERKPRHILELGAGRSTAIIAQAQRQIGGGVFVAIEESPEWLRNHIALMPDALRSDVQLIQRDVAFKDVDGKRCVYYTDIPAYPYELIHVDGPALKSNGGRCFMRHHQFASAAGRSLSCDV